MSFEFPFARGGFQNVYGTRVPWVTQSQEECRPCFAGSFNPCARQGGCSACVQQSGTCSTCQRSDPLLNSVLGRGTKSDNSEPSKRDLFQPESEMFESGLDVNITPEQVASLVNDRARQSGDRRSAARETIADIFAMSDVNYQIRQQLLQRDPGGTGRIIGGRLVNAALADVEVPVGVDEHGRYFGSVALALSQERADQLNGFGRNVINAFTYRQGPGSACEPFVKDYFLFDLGPAQSHPWRERIFQTTFDIDYETAGLGLYVNGMPGRTLYLIRRPQPYYMSFRNPRLNPLFCGAESCYRDEDLSCDQGVYFTTDPIGGGECCAINGGCAPSVFPSTTIVRANGNACSFNVDNSWPDVLFYQSTEAPFRGGLVLVFGQCP